MRLHSTSFPGFGTRDRPWIGVAPTACAVTLLGAAALMCLVTEARASVVLPPGFIIETVVAGGTLNDVSGLAFDASGRLYIIQIIRLSSLSSDGTTLTTEHLRAPLGGGGMVVVGDGRPGFGTDVFYIDYNDEDGIQGDGDGFDGAVWRLAGGGSTVMVVGSPGRNTGDPWGLALGPGGGFGTDFYIVDFQGLSPQAPLLYRVDSGGNATPLLAGWTTAQAPT